MHENGEESTTMERQAKHVVILGGGVAGLGAALGLARRDFSVTIIERDAGPGSDDGDEAFLGWERSSVPQFRQPHGFSARSRNLLLDHAPDVVDLLRDDGIEEVNVLTLLAPPEVWEPEDELLTGFQVRRPAFELALRRAVEAQPGIELLSPSVAAGLLYHPEPGHPLRVSGVRLADGRELEADVVLDCGGRRTPVPRWLAEKGVRVPQDLQDCDIVYYSRHYRRRPESTIDQRFRFGARGDLGGLYFMVFGGDHDAFAVLLAVAPDDTELRALRHSWAWEAVAQNTPRVAPWVDEANASPLHDVQVMAGHDNVRRRYVVDGKPLVLGLLPVGDALCTTNPVYAWGASMALTHAFTAVDAVSEHVGDPTAMALNYDAAVTPEAEAIYRESAASDRARVYRTREMKIPDEDRQEMDRQDVIMRGVFAGALRDPILARALLRRMNLIDSPGAILDDPEVLARATQVRDIIAAKPPTKLGPSRDELLAILAAAAPGPPETRPRQPA